MRLGDAEPDAGVRRLEAFEQPGHQRMRRGWQDAQSDLAQQLAGFGPDFLRQLLRLVHPATQPRGGARAKFGQNDAAAGAVKQLAAAQRLEVGDLTADVRLNYLAPPGHSAQAAGIGHFEEQLDGSDIHGDVSMPEKAYLNSVICA